MCHHFESVDELDAEERADVLESYSDAELEDELSKDEFESLTA
jgi:hypothetical protein